ncbi:molybdate ABC transporter substrate-binding protein [Metabacillus litoralis]|uniref:molybdate ABC transporter substrate-binding protein n=1 Tax=Metabacillus litoralis TaxID=152268 RepID=UPI001CFECB83|nr:molybdate ABC transporter substrate-binding protein [Metabacillus litoralis]
MRNIVCLFLLSFILTGCTSSTGQDEKTELIISAAASLKEAMEEVELLYEENNHIDIQLNLASSGTLSKQIEQGAPADVFLSANNEMFEKLVNANKIRKDSVVSLLKNSLVIISSKKSDIATFEAAMESESLAIGIPETVPAGLYAKEALINMGKWASIEDKLILAKDVRQVLSYVETGNVQVGIVYQTDALITDKVNQISTIDDSLHSSIIYPIGISNSTKELDAASNFCDFLQTEEVLLIFKKYGFETMNEE